MAEDKKHTSPELEIRHMFQRVFGSQEGRIVAANIFANLGFFETDPALIKPELIAFAHRLQHDMGINVEPNWYNYVEKMFEAVTDTDLIHKED